MHDYLFGSAKKAALVKGKTYKWSPIFILLIYKIHFSYKF